MNIELLSCLDIIFAEYVLEMSRNNQDKLCSISNIKYEIPPNLLPFLKKTTISLNPIYIRLLDLIIFSYDNKVKQICRRVIFNLTTNKNNREFLIKTNTLEIIINNCKEFDIISIASLSNLIYEESTKKKFIEEYDGFNFLIYILNSSQNILFLTHTLRGLFSLSSLQEYKIIIFQKFFQILINIINFAEQQLFIHENFEEISQLLINTIGTIGNLAIHPDNKGLIINFNIIPIFNHLLQLINNKGVLHQIVRTIFSLSAKKENRHIILGLSSNSDLNISNFSSNCIPIIFKALDMTDDDMRGNAIGTIGNIAMSDELKPYFIEIMPKILGLLEIQMGPDFKKHLLRTLFTFSSNEKIKNIIRNTENFFKIIGEFLKNENDDLLTDIIGTLANLVSKSNETSIIIRQHGYFPIIFNIIYRHNKLHKSLISQIMRFLFSMAINKENKQEIINNDGLLILKSIILINDTNSELITFAFGTLANIASDFPIEIIKIDAINLSINTILNNKSIEVSCQVNRLLLSLVKDSSIEKELNIINNDYISLDGENRRLRHDYRKIYENMFNPLGNIDIEKKINNYQRDSDIIVIVMKSFSVMLHNSIIYARCPILFDFLQSNSWPLEYKKDSILFHRISDEYDKYDKISWNAFYEFLYTNCVYYHVEQITQNINIAREISELARIFQLSRLMAYCYELNNKAAYLDLEEKKINVLPDPESCISTWTNDMKKLMKNMNYNNQIIQLNDQIIKCNKIVLRCRCPFFASSINWNTIIEKETPIIINTTYNIANIIIEYIYYGYTEKIDLILKNDPILAFQILFISDELLLEGLSFKIQLILIPLIDGANVIDLLQEIQYINCPYLKICCINYIIQNIDLLSNVFNNELLISETKQLLKYLSQN